MQPLENPMPRASRILTALLASALLAGTAVAQDANPAVAARKAHMGLQAFNLGPLGSMAKGETPYDAATAGKLAADLVALSGMLSGPAFSLYFPAGTAAGEVEGTRANAAIWATPDDFLAKAQALTDAATALAATTDLAGLQGAMGAVGGACGACHQAYRVSN
jgi:cytochrome c556